VIEAAERFAPARPLAATRQLLLVALWLSEAATHLGRAARGLDETTAWIAVTGGPADVPCRIIDTTAHWIDAAGQLADVSNRLDASFTRLYGDLTAGVIRLDPRKTTDVGQVVNSSRRAESRFRITLRIIRTHACPSAVAGARKVSRGRAPPFFSTCTL
jgi:hypothetical protein